MKRLALGVAAVAALACLASCSDDSSDDDASDASTSSSAAVSESPSEEATEAPSQDATTDDSAGDTERFATAYGEVATLFTALNAQAEEQNPTNADEANAAAGLDDTTPLLFADYSELEDGSGGSLCLVSAGTGTYVAVSYADGEGEVDLGDGECSYETADATVVGDISADSWTTGAELMGDLLPSGILGS